MVNVNVIIVIINWLYSFAAFSQSVSYLAKNPKVVKHGFTIGWFINIYWLAFGLWFAWYGNIVITAYFIWLNYMGRRNWGGKPIVDGNIKYVALAIGLLATLITNILTNQLFNNIPSTINCFNCMLYACTYTIMALGPKYQKLGQKCKLINLIAYIPMVLMVQPILWGCAIRQSIAISMYVNVLYGKQIKGYIIRYGNGKLAMQQATW